MKPDLSKRCRECRFDSYCFSTSIILFQCLNDVFHMRRRIYSFKTKIFRTFVPSVHVSYYFFFNSCKLNTCPMSEVNMHRSLTTDCSCHQPNVGIVLRWLLKLLSYLFKQPGLGILFELNDVFMQAAAMIVIVDSNKYLKVKKNITVQSDRE